MDKSEMFGISLAMDNRTEAERLDQKGKQRGGVATALGLGPSTPKAAMDTDYQDDKRIKDEIRVNAGFIRDIRCDDDRFTFERLFAAAASGDVSRLDGLEQYLRREGMRLSDSLYQSEGKTALMKALLHLQDGRNQTVERLMEISERMGDIGKFVNGAYTNSYYKGQTALHIAIERRSLYYVTLLVSKGADVHAKAYGKFFKPHDGPNFYFGELPLSLAACTNQPDIVDFLMENDPGADADMADSLGNTVLHALVVVADNTKENTDFITGMYDRILINAARLHPKLKLEEKENHNNLTPLKLAARTGKSGIFSHILKREFHDRQTKHLSRKFTEWVYGPVQASLYDLAFVDSFEDKSVLEILVYGSDIPNRHEMLQTESLNCLLEEKWKSFAGRMFFINFIVYLLYLIIFTAVAYNKKNSKPPFPLERSIHGYLYLSGQLLTTIANCYFFVVGILDMKRKRPKLQTLLVDGYYELLFFLQAVLFLVSAGLYLSGWQEYLSFLVLSLALSWVNLLYYSRGNRHMGIYSVMIQKMILSDIMRFLVIYMVFLFGFSAAVVSLLIEAPAKNQTATKTRLFEPVRTEELCIRPTFRNISYTTLQLFKFTIGMGDMEFTEEYQHKEVFYVLLIGYIILTYILLLNMLIALMNRTVEKLTLETTSIWKLQRAITILDMEKRLPTCLKRRWRCGVETNLGTAGEEDVRWCFRVEEVNWNKWNINLSKINEDPGCSDRGRQPASDNTPIRTNRGRSWRGWFTNSHRGQTNHTSDTELQDVRLV